MSMQKAATTYWHQRKGQIHFPEKISSIVYIPSKGVSTLHFGTITSRQTSQLAESHPPESQLSLAQLEDQAGPDRMEQLFQ